MDSFNRNNHRSNNRSSGGNRGGFRGDRGGDQGGDRGRRDFGGEKQMYSAVCDDCGRNCQVPFRPTSGKPIYCSDCFENHGNGDSHDSRSFNRSDRSDFAEKRMFPAVCDQCGKSCEVPFKPSNDKPIYCDDCFEGKNGEGRPNRGGNNADLQKQLDDMNKKLDDILKAVDKSKTVRFTKTESDGVTKPAKKVVKKKKAE